MSENPPEETAEGQHAGSPDLTEAQQQEAESTPSLAQEQAQVVGAPTEPDSPLPTGDNAPDEQEAEQSRVQALEEENEALRRQLAESQAPKPAVNRTDAVAANVGKLNY